MLMSLISLSDDQIEIVTSAMRQWCRLNRCDIDSVDGRRALTLAIDLVNVHQDEFVLEALIKALGPSCEPEKFVETVNNKRPTPPTSF